MLFYRLKCQKKKNKKKKQKKKTESINPKVSITYILKTVILSKCTTCGSK